MSTNHPNYIEVANIRDRGSITLTGVPVGNPDETLTSRQICHIQSRLLTPFK